MTVQHQLEVYIEKPSQFLCQLSKKVVLVIVSNLLWLHSAIFRNASINNIHRHSSHFFAPTKML